MTCNTEPMVQLVQMCSVFTLTHQPESTGEETSVSIMKDAVTNFKGYRLGVSNPWPAGHFCHRTTLMPATSFPEPDHLLCCGLLVMPPPIWTRWTTA